MAHAWLGKLCRPFAKITSVCGSASSSSVSIPKASAPLYALDMASIADRQGLPSHNQLKLPSQSERSLPVSVPSSNQIEGLRFNFGRTAAPRIRSRPRKQQERAEGRERSRQIGPHIANQGSCTASSTSLGNPGQSENTLLFFTLSFGFDSSIALCTPTPSFTKYEVSSRLDLIN
ncbi:hypothetical protein NCS52_01563400 [Fusarium sp. LHS14.1]|nr:hypothetical protein NCS52_01563400 [Fusarium sp. LHS14.1]